MMIRIQYDGYNRDFKILDHVLSGLLEDGDVYVLVIPDSKNDPDIDWIELHQTTMAHA